MERQVTLDFLAKKFHLDLAGPLPIDLPKEIVSRKILAETWAELGFTSGAEIGVAAGEHSLTLLETIPNLTLYSVDPWRADTSYWSFRRATLAGWEAQARARLAPYPNCHILKATSMEAAAQVPDESLDFCYIDGAHDFKNIAMDICEWIKKVRPGGVLYGHDFCNIHNGKYACHVSYVVKAYVESHKITPWFLIGRHRKHKRGILEDIPEWMIVL